jgi:hypothetical protein
MIAPLLAEFDRAERLLAATRRLRRDGHHPLNAFTPFRIPELEDVIAPAHPPIRLLMLAGGVAMAAFAFWLQWYSAVLSYPLNIGGRPLNSWPVFLLVPFEVGMLAAAIAGFMAFLRATGFPRLHDSVFDWPDLERATQDRFFLVAEPAASADTDDLRRTFEDAGALRVTEVRQ